MAITLFKNKTGSLWNPSSAKHCIRRQTSAEIVFSGLYTIWKHGTTVVSSMRAQIGDTVKYINSTTVGCYDSNSNERWRVVASKATNTVLYEYTGTPAITNFTYAITSTESKSVVASGVDRRKMKYAVNVTAGSGWTGVYTSTSSTATSGNASGHKYEVGERVYYFAKTTDATLANYFAPFTLPTPVYNSNGTKYYCIGSVFIVNSGHTVTIPALEPKPLTIYFTGVGTQWKVNGNGASVSYMTAYYGDYLSISGNIITCKYPSKAIRWTVTASIMTDTVEWDFGGNIVLPTTNDEQITSVKTIKNEAGTAVKKKYAVSINGLGTAGSTTSYLSTSLTATSGSNSGSTFDYGANVFAFAKIPHATLSTYTTPSSWEYRQHDASNIYYLVGNLGQVTENTNKNIIYASSLSAKQSVTINLTGTGITWKQSNTTRTSMTAYVGDTIKNTSSTAVGCYYTGIDGTLQLRWSVTANRSADTTQYKYTGTPTIASFEWKLNSTASKSISAGGISTALQSYTITWKNYDGTTLKTDTLLYGATPSYTGVTPGRSETAQYTYTFSGWNPSIATVTGTTSYTAQFTSTVRKYTVTWKSQDGSTTLETDTNVAYGTKPTFNGTAPTKSSTARYNYTFAGWSTSANKESGTVAGSLAGITGNTTYYAAFSKTTRKYTVRWYNDSTLLETDLNVEYAGKAIYNGATPKKASTVQYDYLFTGWSVTNGATSGGISGSMPGITGDTNYYAAFTPVTRKYAVTVTKPAIADEIWLSTTNGASSGSASGAKFDYGSTVYAMVKVNASTASAYNISKDACGWTQNNASGQYNWYIIGSVSVTGAVTLTYTNPSKKSSVIKINTSVGVSSVYLSTNSEATSGKASGTSFEYGDGTVYGFVKMSSTNQMAHNIPNNWTCVHYDGSYYYYRVGSIRADGSAYRTISYTAATAKPKLSQASVSISVTSGRYTIIIFNNNSTTVTVTGAWYNKSGTKVANISSFTLGSYTSSNGTTVAVSQADAVYASITLSASGYISSTTTTDLVYGKLQAPQIMSTDVTSQDYELEYRTNVTYTYNKYVTATIKNPNNVQVTLVIDSPDIEDACHRGSPNTLAAGATGKVTFSANPGGRLAVQFTKAGRGASSYTYISCPYDSSGGGGTT